MRTITRFALTAIIAFAAGTVFAQEKEDSFMVYGNCGMCKKRIEKAAIAAGATTANWDKTTHFLTVVYNAAKTTNQKLQQKIANVGHDTQLYTAKDKAYDKLPLCCQYERKAKPGSGKADPHE
jgi:hypothetical protein